MNDSTSAREAAVTALTASMTQVFRAGALIKNATPPATPGLEHGAMPVLFLTCEHPRRVSEIATSCHADVSTISRHVTALTRLGLVEKVPDEQDRRASLVTITDEGRAAVGRVRATRDQVFAQILRDWDTADIDALRAALQRLADDVEDYITDHRTTKGA